ncbi:uncharacterized protein LOC113218381 [Rhizophagus clarus]|uniref:Uncharacterized protein LOC113218381 n=1 Tax=Rhizophagus clarus TaxID=94130 RepID=A0A8H3L0F9_9GLOM|nr:uncharacterized protein LOC113218381 [Rhizophagus clarus]
MPPTSPIWAHFNKLGHVAGFWQACAQCKYCNYKINAAANKCIVEQEFFLRYLKKISQDLNYNRKKSINNFVDKISLAEQNEAELLLAQAFYQCGLFLSLPELEPIKILFQNLRPYVKLPSRKALSTILLDKVYEDTKNEVKDLINSANYICLISGGYFFF